MNREQIARALINELFHSRRIMVALFVVVNAVALTAGLKWPRGYTASTTVLVDDRNIVQPLMQGAAVATDVTDRSKNARELMFGRKIMDYILEERGGLTSQTTPEEKERIIDGIKKRTRIDNVGRNIIRISYTDEHSERAFRVTQKFAELFVRESILAQAAESSAAFAFIEKQTQEYQDKLARTEEKLKELRSANLDARGGDAEIGKRMNELQTSIERTNQELRVAEIKGASLEKQLSVAVGAIAADKRESEYRARIGELQLKLDALRLNYLDAHPDIVQVKQQIQNLTAEIVAERERRAQSTRNGRPESDESATNNPIYQQLRRGLSENKLLVESLEARLSDLQARLQQEMSRGRLVHSSDARMAELTRDYQVNSDIYQDLLRRRENARVSMNLDRDRQGLTLKILERATMPRRSGPRFWHFVAGGILLGILLPVGLLFARLNLDPRIRISSGILATHNVPVAVVPHLWSPRELRHLRWEFSLLTLIAFVTVAVSAALSLLGMPKVL